MRDLLISRRRIITAGAAGALGVVLNPSAVFADDGEEVSLLRWDLAQIIQGTVLTGGSVRATDAASGDIATLTGSGEARPGDRTAAGGGTFVHTHANGSVVAHGVYVVTGFNSFKNGHGSLAGTPLTDGIGHKGQSDSGILRLGIKASIPSGTSIEAKLGVECALPGDTSGAVEGITLDVTVAGHTFHFRQVPEGGVTVFHALGD
jgi:hypothetical protein